MKRTLETLCILGSLATFLLFLGVRPHGVQPVAPAQPLILPVAPAKPPNDGRRRLRPRWEAPAPDGTEPLVDYPPELWFKNIGSKKDGSGMCVFTAFEFMCLWSGLEEFHGFRDWCAERYPGGGYPEKLSKLVDAYARAHNIQDVVLAQYEGSDLTWLEKCLHNGWMPCVTLYHSGRKEYPRLIYHMTCCPHLDGARGAIQDNNFKDYEWFQSRDAFARAISLDGKYWGVAIVSVGGRPVVGPLPSPSN